MPLDQIIQNMDSEGIDKMIIMETPSAIYYGRHKDYGIPDAAEKYPDRFLCLYSGDAITMLDKFASKTYTKTDEDKYIALLEAAMKTGKYAGFGEVALRHGPVAPQASLDEPAFADVTVPGDHPWVLILSDIAAEYDVPIDIHMEATDQTIPGLEKLLEHNINTKIIWSHAGWELVMNGKASPGLFRQLMENHPNLYTSIKIGYDTTEVSFLDKKGLITSEWMALLKDYPDRFMIGSDIKPGLRQNEFAIISGVRAMLKQLPASVFKKIERENAIEIFKIK